MPKDKTITDNQSPEEHTSEQSNTEVDGAEEIKRDDSIIYFRAKRVLTTEEHENLHDKIEIEMERTGLKIVLVPFLVDLAEGEG